MIGGMRCGTRAFLKYMVQHRQVLAHRKAHDPHFFSSEENWSRGIASYLEGWRGYNPRVHKVRFESSTHYTKYPAIKDVPERMRRSGINLRLIYSVRDPVKRIESHLVHNAGKGYLDLKDARRRRKFLKFALNYSRYGMQLEQYMRFFSLERLFLFKLEDLVSDPLRVVKGACDFLEIDFDPRLRRVPRIDTRYVAEVEGVGLTEDEKVWLRDELRDDIDGFLRTTGMSTAGWHMYVPADSRVGSPGVVSQDNGRAPSNAVVGATLELHGPVGNGPNGRKQRATGIIGPSRYAMVTVDTEALPKRASSAHVERLIWGECEGGRAGIRELCEIATTVSSPMIFFVDACETELYGEEVRNVIRWLDSTGHDVQLHMHPEVLPEEFWRRHGLSSTPRYMNRYSSSRALFALGHFSKIVSGITGKPVLGFRAGSFRWNYNVLDALGQLGVRVSFNNRMGAYRSRRCVYGEATNLPYAWGNGVIEVPVTERNRLIREGEITFEFPASQRGVNNPWRVLRPFAARNSFLVMLLHSWSLLHRESTGFFEYRNDRRIDELTRVLRRMAKDYDIVNTREFLELHDAGKIVPTHVVTPKA